VNEQLKSSYIRAKLNDFVEKGITDENVEEINAMLAQYGDNKATVLDML